MTESESDNEFEEPSRFDEQNKFEVPDDPEHFSLDDMLGYEEEDDDYSLEELSQAYAQILAEQDSIQVPLDPEQAATDAEALTVEIEEEGEPIPALSVDSQQASAHSFLQPLSLTTANQDLGQDDPLPVTPERIVESILFVGTSDNSPISGRLIASLMRGVSPEEVEQYVTRLNQSYELDGAAYRIEKDDLGFRMQLHRSMVPVRNQFYGQVKEVKLSQPIIDVLSVIAYHQPVEREVIERLVGRPSGANINQLLRRNLIKMERGEGRQKLYSTTERFLELFGLDEIEDLPQSEAMDDE